MRAATEALAERAPNAELLAIDGADHVPHLSCPDAYCDAVLAFHARIAARTNESTR